MTLTDPREALADQSNFISYLVGLAGLAPRGSTLAAEGARRSEPAQRIRRLRAYAARAREPWRGRSNDSPIRLCHNRISLSMRRRPRSTTMRWLR